MASFERTVRNLEKGPYSHIAGIRVISMAWIILGHSFSFVATSAMVRNMADAANVIRKGDIQAVLSGAFAVDTFFCVSGFLLAAFAADKLAGHRSGGRDSTADNHGPANDRSNNLKEIEMSPQRREKFEREHLPAEHLSQARGHDSRAVERGEVRSTVDCPPSVSAASAARPPSSPAAMRTLAWFVAHRWARLAPLLYFVMFVYAIWLPWVGSGPMWPRMVDEIQNGFEEGCRGAWWKVALLINNLSNAAECVPWSWYLANDFQFFVFGAALLLLRGHSSKAFKAAVCISFIGCFVSLAVTALQYDLSSAFVSFSRSSKQLDMFHKMKEWGVYYYRPWNRVAPFLVGIVAALIGKDTGAKEEVRATDKIQLHEETEKGVDTQTASTQAQAAASDGLPPLAGQLSVSTSTVGPVSARPSGDWSPNIPEIAPSRPSPFFSASDRALAPAHIIPGPGVTPGILPMTGDRLEAPHEKMQASRAGSPKPTSHENDSLRGSKPSSAEKVALLGEHRDVATEGHSTQQDPNWGIHCLVFAVMLSQTFLTILAAWDIWWPKWFDITYLVFEKTIWACCVSWFLVSLARYPQSPLRQFLSAKPFLLLSPLVYCAYLIHPVVQEFKAATGVQAIHFSRLIGYCTSLSYFALTFAFCVPLVLLIEIPCAKVAKLVGL